MRTEGAQADANRSLLRGGNLIREVPNQAYNASTVLEAFSRGDYAEVFRSASPFAEAGHPDAQCMLSLLYQCGYGVPQDPASAERWLIRATEQQSALAWNNLGTLYLMGLPGVARNPAKALECYLRARELGFDRADPYPPLLDL